VSAVGATSVQTIGNNHNSYKSRVTWVVGQFTDGLWVTKYNQLWCS